MDVFEKRYYDVLLGVQDAPIPDRTIDSPWLEATERDAQDVARLARRQLRQRDSRWGVAMGVVIVAALGGLAWYTPTQTVTVTEIEVRDAPDRACLDALDKAGELFLAFSKVTDTLARRDAAEQRAHDAVYAMDRDALTAASNEMFVENDIMGTQIRQASEVDLTTPTEACRG